jgi:hypothetical protein
VFAASTANTRKGLSSWRGASLRQVGVWASVPVPCQAIWFINRAQHSTVDHDVITATLRKGDGATASALIREHVLRGREATISHLRAIDAPVD